MRIPTLLVTVAVAGATGACDNSPTEATNYGSTIATQRVSSNGDTRGVVSSAARSVINFITQLSGEAEVQTPAVETQATGVSKFQLSKDGTSMTFFVNVAQLENVRFAHLHLGAAGSNGPIVVDLRLDKVSGPVNGRYAEGTTTSSSMKGPLLGQPLSALVDAIVAGRIYVNVHTDRFPGGELRGQVR